MWQANRGCNPQAQQEPTQWRGKIPARHTTNPTRITIKGHLTWTPVLAQAGDHRFQCRLFVEIVSGLGPQGDRGSCVTEIADFDDRLAFADAGLCSGETEPPSLQSIWISSTGARSSLGWGSSLERVSRQPVACRIFQIVRLERDRGTCAACSCGSRGREEGQAHASNALVEPGASPQSAG